MSIWDLLRAKDANGLGTLLASGNVDVNQSGAGEQTPLHLASELDAKDCVMALLGAGAATEAEDGQLRTPLSLACESKSFESAQMLITGGASLAARDKNDMTPLHWVAQYGQAAGALALLRLAVAKGADIDAANYQMQSPLYLAIQRGNTQCALALVDAGASLAVEDETAGTMLHLTCQYAGSLGDAADSLVLLQRLLKPSGGKKVDVNSRDREKRTPLHWAAGKNALPCVTALLEAGADVNAADWAEHTPLQWAASTDAVESVEALLAAGARSTRSTATSARPCTGRPTARRSDRSSFYSSRQRPSSTRPIMAASPRCTMPRAAARRARRSSSSSQRAPTRTSPRCRVRRRPTWRLISRGRRRWRRRRAARR